MHIVEQGLQSSSSVSMGDGSESGHVQVPILQNLPVIYMSLDQNHGINYIKRKMFILEQVQMLVACM